MVGQPLFGKSQKNSSDLVSGSFSNLLGPRKVKVNWQLLYTYIVHQAPSQWLNSAQDDCPVSVSRRGPDQLCVPRTCWRRRGRPWSYYRSKGEPCSCLCQCRQATLTRKAPSTDCPDDRRQPPKDIDSRNPWTGSWMLVDPWHLPVTIKSFQPSWWSPAQSLQQLQELSKCPVHRGFPRK